MVEGAILVRTGAGATGLLSAVIREACESVPDAADLPLVPLVQWALRTGARQAPRSGASRPHRRRELASPPKPFSRNRSWLAARVDGCCFPKLPAVVADYAEIENQEAVVRFLEHLGVRGGGRSQEPRRVDLDQPDTVLKTVVEQSSE